MVNETAYSDCSIRLSGGNVIVYVWEVYWGIGLLMTGILTLFSSYQQSCQIGFMSFRIRCLSCVLVLLLKNSKCVCYCK